MTLFQFDGITAVVVAAEVAAAAVAAAMVAEDGLVAARWSCLPIKVYGLPKYLSFLQTLLKGYIIVYVVLLRSANDPPTQLICLGYGNNSCGVSSSGK